MIHTIRTLRRTAARRRPCGRGPAACLVLALAAGACADQGPDAGPGPLTATLVSPNGAEGAAVLSVFGEGVEGASASGGRLFSERVGDTLKVVVVAEPGGTLRFQVMMSDTTRAPQARVEEVAGPDDALRESLEGYSVEFAR